MTEYIRLALATLVLFGTGFYFVAHLEGRIAVLERNVQLNTDFNGKVVDFLIHHKPEK